MVTIYAEKASLAKVIADALGAGRRISNPKNPVMGHWEFEFDFEGKREKAVLVHGSGHLAGLADPENYDPKYAAWSYENYPILPDKYRVLTSSSENFKKIDKANDKSEYMRYVSGFMQQADWLINATDPDREGELIFSYVLEAANIKKPYKRVILPDLTENTVIHAFLALREGIETVPIQYAGRARSIADWLFGMNLTVAATNQYGSKGNTMSVGRVQTATLGLIVEREKAVTGHKKTPFWRIISDFGGFTAEHSNGKFDVQSEAEKILADVQGKPRTVTKNEQKKRLESAPLLYNSTGLQIAAGNILGFELKKTVSIIQSLYEKGLITYPRTSSEHLPEEMRENVKATILSLFKLAEYSKLAPKNALPNDLFTKRHFDSEKVGSHTAIIPTFRCSAGFILSFRRRKSGV